MLDPKTVTWQDTAALSFKTASEINHHDVQELLSEARLAFCVAYDSHDPAKAKFTTWLALLTRQRLLSWVRPKRNQPFFLLHTDESGDGGDCQNRVVSVPEDKDGHWTDGLSADAEIVLDLCLDPPDEVLEATGGRMWGNLIRKAVWSHLLKCGWGEERVEEAFEEIREEMK